MQSVNLGLMAEVRAKTRSDMTDIIRGRVKTGKEIVRDSHQKLINKSLRRHAAVLSKFLSEEGKGGSFNFTV